MSAFDVLKAKLERKPGITDPGGLARVIGERKLGKAEFRRRMIAGIRRRAKQG